MRYLETLPAWAARQRSRRLIRHGDEKVVRWINHNQMPKDETPAPSSRGEPAHNENVVAFARSAQAS